MFNILQRTSIVAPMNQKMAITCLKRQPLFMP